MVIRACGAVPLCLGFLMLDPLVSHVLNSRWCLISRANFVIAGFHLISLHLVLIYYCISYKGRCHLIRLLH